MSGYPRYPKCDVGKSYNKRLSGGCSGVRSPHRSVKRLRNAGKRIGVFFITNASFSHCDVLDPDPLLYEDRADHYFDKFERRDERIHRQDGH